MSTVATTRNVYSPILEMPGAATVEVQARYRGVLIGTCHLDPVGRRRSRRSDRHRGYVIGAGPSVDAPASVDVIGGESLPLLTAWSGGYLLNTTPAMRGRVQVNGQLIRLEDYVRERGRSFNLPDTGSAHIECGEMCFEVQHTPAPETVPRPWWSLRWAEHKYTLGTVAGLGLLLLLVLFAPPEPTAISDGGLSLREAVRISSTIIPKEQPQLPEVKEHKPGDEGQAAAGPDGKMGTPKSTNTRGRWAMEGKSATPQISKERAAELARNAGVLGFLNDNRSPIANVMGPDMAMGSDPETVLGGLMGTDINASNGVINGLGMTGSGAGGSGTGQNTVGAGNWPHMGHLGLGRGGNGTDYSRTVGQLRGRRSMVPTVDISGGVITRGSLDKEIIRRIIRSHMNEVKYCYEQQLTTHADLAGRISVQFAISPTGQVLTSVMQSTTMSNVQVESCVVNAVKRWSFPKPEGGGLVMVMYPFSFSPAGG